MYTIKDLQDPSSLFKKRMNYMENRILKLNSDYQNVNHYFSKAIIETELEQLVDEYLERSFILQRTNREESN